MGKRVIDGVFATYRRTVTDHLGQKRLEPRTGLRGQEVDLPDDEEKRLEGLGMLAKKGTKPAPLEEYERTLLADIIQEPGSPPSIGGEVTSADVAPVLVDGEEVTVEPTTFDARGATPDEARTWLETEKPTASEVVDAAHDDPAAAKLLLDAEVSVSGGDPRKTVAEPLEKITEG